MHWLNSKIALRGLGVVGLLVLVVFMNSLRANAEGYTFATYGIDLKIDSKAWYNGVMVPSATWALKNLVPGSDKFFNFDDIKPGDYGCNVISIHVKNTDAWACMDFTNFEEAENGVNEPEGEVDTTDDPDLADNTEFFGWQETDGDGKFEPWNGEKPLFGTSTKPASEVLNDTTYAIGDYKNGNSCKPNKTRYVGMCWCAGDLTVDLKTGKQVCDGTKLGNEAQTDSFSVDVEIRTSATKDKPKYICTDEGPHKDKYKKPKGNNGVGNGEDPPPPGGGNVGNDGPGTGPGNPGGSNSAPGQNKPPTNNNWNDVRNYFGGWFNSFRR